MAPSSSPSPRSGPEPLRLHSFDEFMRLRSIVVGTPVGANHPEIDTSFENFFQPPQEPELRARAVGPIPRAVVDEVEEDIQGFVAVLQQHGVEVLRPDAPDCSVPIRSPFWGTTQLYSLMPRDSLMVVGDLFVEVPSPTRARYFETFAFRSFMERYVQRGAHVVAAPKPMLTAATYDDQLPNKITEHELLFDAANCVRLGRDIFMDVNRSANARAPAWLERTIRGLVSDDLRVHPMSLGNDHVDVTLIPLRPGVLLVDPVKVTEATIPAAFRGWDRIVVEEVMPLRDYGLAYPLASNDGIGRNVLMLGDDTVIVDDIQQPLIRALEKRRFKVVPLRYRHGRTLGGSWHCITLDTHREGGLDGYLARPGAVQARVDGVSAHTQMFKAHGVDASCGLGDPGGSSVATMRAVAAPSTALLDGVTTESLRFAAADFAPLRSTMEKAIHAEHDAELLCKELERRVAAGALTLTPAFRAFEHAWRRDELDHTIGFAQVHGAIYGEDPRAILEGLRARRADFVALDAFLRDELSLCLLLAYDELATTRSYARDWHDLYPRLACEQVTTWIQRVAADEARHYHNLLEVLRGEHRGSLRRAPGILDAILEADLLRPRYQATFALDHDDPSVFPEAELRACRERVGRDVAALLAEVQ